MKVNLFLRLFLVGDPLPCAAAHVDVEVTPNSISYSNTDLRTFVYFMNEQEKEGISWQNVGNAIFAAYQSEHQVSGRIYVGGDYEITWRKV